MFVWVLKWRCASLSLHPCITWNILCLKMSNRVFKILINSSWSTRLVVRYQSGKCVSDVTCWRCNKEISLSSDEVMFTCPCDRKVLLPPITKNYFLIMGW